MVSGNSQHGWQKMEDDGGKVMESSQRYQRTPSYKKYHIMSDVYFCSKPEEFIRRRFPIDDKWQLLNTPIFQCGFFLASKDLSRLDSSQVQVQIKLKADPKTGNELIIHGTISQSNLRPVAEFRIDCSARRKGCKPLPIDSGKTVFGLGPESERTGLTQIEFEQQAYHYSVT